MSTIQLSDQLLSDIQAVLEKNDPQAGDAGIAVQYLAALTGILAAQFPGETERKRQVLRQLMEFTGQVFEDQLDGDDGSAGSDSDNPYGPGFGVWRPS